MKKIITLLFVFIGFANILIAQTPNIEINPFQQMANPIQYQIHGVAYRDANNFHINGKESDGVNQYSGYFIKQDWEHWTVKFDSTWGLTPLGNAQCLYGGVLQNTQYRNIPIAPMDSRGNIYTFFSSSFSQVLKYNPKTQYSKFIDSSNAGYIQNWLQGGSVGYMVIDDTDAISFNGSGLPIFNVVDTNFNLVYDTIYGNILNTTANSILDSKLGKWVVSDSFLFLYSNHHLKYCQSNYFPLFNSVFGTDYLGNFVAITSAGLFQTGGDTIMLFKTNGVTSSVIRFKDSLLAKSFSLISSIYYASPAQLVFKGNQDGSYTFFVFSGVGITNDPVSSIFHTISSTGQFVDDVTLEDISPQLTCYMDMCLVTKDGLLAWNTNVYPNSPCHHTKANFPMVLFNRLGVKKFSGRVFYDLNHNATFDAGDFPASQDLIHQNVEEYNALSYSDGKYFLSYLDSSKTYTINCTPTNPNYTFTTSSTYTVNPSINSCQNIDFGLSIPSNFNDLSIRISHTENRPGYQVLYWLDYKNKLASAVGDSITFSFDDSLSLVSSSVTPTTINGHHLTWNINHLTPFSDSIIKCVFTVAQHITLHHPLKCTAKIFPIHNDQDSTDNISNPFIETHAPNDPNYKEVQPVGNVSPDSTLTYTIHFQNTGNDTAFNIVLIDTLDTNLNYSTFQILTSSSPVIAEIKDSSFLYLKFYNILLPDSGHSQLNSHGFVQYSIKSKHTLNTYNNISNSASIYFDFNTPVKTNTIGTTICQHPVSTILNKGICLGDSFYFKGKFIFNTGVFKDTLLTYYGCDSFVILNLMVNNPSAININHSICSNQFYLFNGHQLNANGTYYDTLLNHFGCDSFITLHLIVEPTNSDSIKQTITGGSSYNFNGHSLTAAGIYKDTLLNHFGCDSIITLTLSVTSGINNIGAANTIKVFPNPTDQTTTISLQIAVNNATIKLINLTGQTIIENQNQSGDHFTLDISQQAQGIYFVEIRQADNVWRTKLVKQ